MAKIQLQTCEYVLIDERCQIENVRTNSNEVTSVSSKRAQRYQTVNRFETIARANLGKSNDISALREIAAVKKRTI